MSSDQAPTLDLVPPESLQAMRERQWNEAALVVPSARYRETAMKDEPIWKISSEPTYLRCKDLIMEVGEIAAIQKWDQPQSPGVILYKIEVRLKRGAVQILDFSHDDEACGPEPRDRAFEDIWRELAKRVSA